MRGLFARICLELDITKTLLAKFKLKRIIRMMEYGGFPLVCFACEVVRHRKEDCLKDKAKKGEQTKAAIDKQPSKNGVDQTKNGNQRVRKDADSFPEIKEGYKPWMIVARKPHRQTTKKDSSKGYGKGNKGSTNGLESNNIWKFNTRIASSTSAINGQEF